MFTLHNGDCREYMKSLPDKSVSAIITDPPYGVNIASWDGEMPPQDILSECLRVSSGAVIWFGGAKTLLNFGEYAPRPSRILIWSPKFTFNKSSDMGMFYRYHPIACWNLSEPKINIGSDVLDDMTEGRNWWNHPGTKPVSIMKKLVHAFGGDCVLDPFTGSGTTGVACVQLGIKFIGCEISPEYYSIAKKRIEQASLQKGLFTPSNTACTGRLDSSATQSSFTAEGIAPAKARGAKRRQ